MMLGARSLPVPSSPWQAAQVVAKSCRASWRCAECALEFCLCCCDTPSSGIKKISKPAVHKTGLPAIIRNFISEPSHNFQFFPQPAENVNHLLHIDRRLTKITSILGCNSVLKRVNTG